MLTINKLIIIAGLSRSGKSTLLTQFDTEKLNKLRKILCIDSISNYQLLHAIEIDQLNQVTDKLIIHYDIFARYSNQNGFDNLHKLMKNSKQIKIITLCASSNTLIERMDSTLLKSLIELQEYDNNPPFEDKLPLINKLRNSMITQQYYKDEKIIPQLYNNWFNFFKQYPACQHWLVDSKNPNSPIPCPAKVEDIFSFIRTT